MRLQGTQQSAAGVCNCINRRLECGRIGPGGVVESTDFAHILQCRRLDIVLAGGWFEIVKRPDIPAHLLNSISGGLVGLFQPRQHF